MARDARFWRNVTIIALLHIALLIAFLRWSREPKKAITSSITWMKIVLNLARNGRIQASPGLLSGALAKAVV